MPSQIASKLEPYQDAGLPQTMHRTRDQTKISSGKDSTVGPNYDQHRDPQIDQDVDQDSIWHAYWLTGYESDRNELVERYLYLVNLVVLRLPHRIVQHWDADDLRSFGNFGLIRAIEHRNANLINVSFAGYAQICIRGAIYDELRALDWLPRQARKQVIDFRVTEDDLRSSLGRSPTGREVLSELAATDRRQDFKILSAVRRSQFTSLDQPLGQNAELSRLDRLTSNDNVERDVFSQIDGEQLWKSIASLPEQQRAVISLRYRDGLTLQQTGEVIGLSSTRIWQIENKALRALRQMLRISCAA